MDNTEHTQARVWTISEVVDDLRREGFKVTTQQIRKYESQKLINPVTKDSSSGYRLFGEKDVDRLRLLLALRLFGFSIKNISRFFKLLDMYPIGNLVSKMEMFKTVEPVAYSKELDSILDFIDEFLAIANKMNSTLRRSMEQFEVIKKKYEEEKTTIKY
ncbi:MAG: MerR family transcriptional regulator [Candidatus Omnitrophota bacterium]